MDRGVTSETTSETTSAVPSRRRLYKEGVITMRYISGMLAVALILSLPVLAHAGYLAGSPCAGVPKSDTCPDRSYGWQQREHDGTLSPEASGGGDSGGSSGGDSGGSSGGDSGGSGTK